MLNVRPESMERITTKELADAFIEQQIKEIREQVGDKKVILALSFSAKDIIGVMFTQFKSKSIERKAENFFNFILSLLLSYLYTITSLGEYLHINTNIGNVSSPKTLTC